MSKSEAPNFMACGKGNCKIFVLKISKNIKYIVTFAFGIVASKGLKGYAVFSIDVHPKKNKMNSKICW